MAKVKLNHRQKDMIELQKTLNHKFSIIFNYLMRNDWIFDLISFEEIEVQTKTKRELKLFKEYLWEKLLFYIENKYKEFKDPLDVFDKVRIKGKTYYQFSEPYKYFTEYNSDNDINPITIMNFVFNYLEFDKDYEYYLCVYDPEYPDVMPFLTLSDLESGLAFCKLEELNTIIFPEFLKFIEMYKDIYTVFSSLIEQQEIYYEIFLEEQEDKLISLLVSSGG